MDIVSRVKALNLPLGKYLVFGSGVLEIRGIRKAKDTDVLVNEELYQELKKRGWKRKWFFWRVFICKALTKGQDEAFTNIHWGDYQPETDDLISKAEYVEGVPFLSIEELLRFKKLLPREKDKRDVILIENYLASRKEKI